MAGSGGVSNSNTACAACKYQRRKCTADCPLSPYFPPDQPKRFQNVHRLFGVSNILRILKHVDPSKREDTVKSIAYEADTREKDPVHGCLGVITILQNQVSRLKDELAVARDQLYLLQQQHNFHQQAQMHQIVGSFGGSATVANGSSALGTSAILMQQLEHYNGMHQLGNSDFAKSNPPLPISSFEADQYLRTDNFEIKPRTDNFDIKPASTSRYDISRYISEESPVQQRCMQLGAAVVKEEQCEAVDHHEHRGAVAAAAGIMQHYNGSMAGSGTSGGHTLVKPDMDSASSFDTLDPYATAIRRRGSTGALNDLTAAVPDSELGRTTEGHHELRSAGVYLTLTNSGS